MDPFNPFSLTGKTVFITGASSGIGRGIAIACSKMGADVILNGRNGQRLNETLSKLAEGNHRTEVADLNHPEEVSAMVARLPVLQGIVHCAGIGQRVLCKQVTATDLNEVMDANFKGPVLLQTEILKQKKIAKAASVVFISSIAIDDPSQTLSEISSTVDDKQVTALVWYDNSSQVQSGDKFYYRVAAVNEYGVGTLSSLDEYADQDRSKGAALVSAETLTPYAMLKADHTIALSWPVCLNADAYYVFAAKAVNGEAPTEDVAWGNPLTPAANNNQAAVAGLETVLSKEDLNGLVDGEISDAELYFRILPVKQDMIASYETDSGAVVITLNEGYTNYPTEINKTLGENAAETYLPGRSTFGKSLYFKKAPPTLVSISATQGTEIGTVKVEAELNMNSEIGYLYDVQLVRTCWYGDETGVYPLSLPPANTDPSKHFPKKNQAKQSRVVNYKMNDSFKNGKISWEDPMPDFDRNGNLFCFIRTISFANSIIVSLIKHH